MLAITFFFLLFIMLDECMAIISMCKSIMVIVDDSTFVKTRIDHFDVAHRWTMNLSQIIIEERNSCPEMKSYDVAIVHAVLSPRCSSFDSFVS